MYSVFSLITVLSVVVLHESPPQRVELDHGFYLTARPARIEPHVPAPLVICLHGTDNHAADMLAFWRSRTSRLPFVFVAPQSHGQGWGEADLPFLREMLEHVRQSPGFDSQRVFLAGHSAGGAMVLHLLYAEDFPATAAAITAGYVPPTVSADLIAARSAVPVFCAVGRQDPSHDRMQQGVNMLRLAGVKVKHVTPPVGHVLDEAVGNAMLAWFEDRCRSAVGQTLTRARMAGLRDDMVGDWVIAIEAILAYPDVYFADQVADARRVLAEVEMRARRSFLEADRLVKRNKPFDARRILLTVEKRYLPARMGVEARRKRLRLEAMVNVAPYLEPNSDIFDEKGSP